MPASTVGKGLVQIEIGWHNAVEEVFGTEINDSIFPVTLVRFGLTRRIEVRTGYTGKRISDFESELFSIHEEQAGDAYLGLKWRFLGQKKYLPDIALHAGGIFSLRSERSSTTAEETGPQFGLLFQHRIGRGIFLGYNMAADWYNVVMIGGKKDYRIRNLYSVCVDVIPVRWCSLFAEFVYIEPKLDDDPESRYVALGYKIRILDNLQVDTAYGIKRGRWADGEFVHVGISARIPR